MPRTAPHRMKNVAAANEADAAAEKRPKTTWCWEPVEQSDPGDPEHQTLSPPSGEHVGEITLNTRVATSRREGGWLAWA